MTSKMNGFYNTLALMKSKLHNRITMRLHIVMWMLVQRFYTLESFPSHLARKSKKVVACSKTMSLHLLDFASHLWVFEICLCGVVYTCFDDATKRVWWHRSSQNCHRGGYGSWGEGFPTRYLTLKRWEGLLWLFEIFDNPLPSNSFEDSKVNLALKQWKYELNDTQKTNVFEHI